MDLRVLSKTLPTVLNGHSGKYISSVQFMKPYKSSKTASEPKTTKAKVPGKTTNSESFQQAATTLEPRTSKNSTDNLHVDAKENFETVSEYRGISNDNKIEMSEDKTDTISQRKYSTRVLEESKYPAKKTTYERPVQNRIKIDRLPISGDKSPSLHLSAYGEPVSAHSSVISTTSKIETRAINIDSIDAIEPISRHQRQDSDDNLNKRDIESIDAVMAKQDELEEFVDFTDQQKEYIQKVIDSRLSEQREKLANYFQNMQIEMIRQFQIQYLDLVELIENAAKKKNKSRFMLHEEDD